MEEIYDKLKNNEIIELNLGYRYIENIDKLADCLKYNTSLKCLGLDNNEIENIDKLGESLKYNSSLKDLSLSENKIENIDNFTKCLRYNSTLEKLYLYNNKIENIDKLGKNLIYNYSLKIIYIWGNNIENIDNFIYNYTNNSLTELYLDVYKIKNIFKLCYFDNSIMKLIENKKLYNIIDIINFRSKKYKSLTSYI